MKQVATTSRKAFRESDFHPSEWAVVHVLRETCTSLNRKQISLRSGLTINNVCGRVGALMDAKVLVSDGEWKCPISGNTVEFLKLAKRYRA